MEWREVMGLVELRRELERMNDRWRKTVEGAEERMKEREEREKCRREGREYVPPPPRDRSLSAELAENRKRARDGTDSVEPEVSPCFLLSSSVARADNVLTRPNDSPRESFSTRS